MHALLFRMSLRYILYFHTLERVAIANRVTQEMQEKHFYSQ
jgi:hypothetical protein